MFLCSLWCFFFGGNTIWNSWKNKKINKKNKKPTEMRKNDQSNLREKSGRRSEICRLWRQRRDSFSREARAEQVNLIKVGRVWWFVRNKRILKKLSATLSSPLPDWTTPFSDVTTGCATIFGHVRISPFLLFLRAAFCVCEKWVSDSIFPGLFMTKSI